LPENRYIKDGKIKLLQALPDSFKAGNISVILAKGNITVAISRKDNQLKEFSLCSPTKQKVIIEYEAVEKTVELLENKVFYMHINS